MPLNVETIEPHGFCSGVAGALQKAFGALGDHGGTVYCLHELVHNETVVKDFELRGMKFVESLGEVPHGATVVFSAHGVAPAVRREAEMRALHVVDATCPFVARVHRTVKAAAERGVPVVIVGNAKHAEVIGVAGEAEGGRVAVVRSAAEVDGIGFPADSEVVVVSQTTLSADEVAEAAAALKAKFPKASFSPASEVCNATRDRQRAVREFAEGHPGAGVLVLGSASSSNTRRLAEIAEAAGARAWRAGNMDELAAIDFGGICAVGVTSGASTPESFLRDAIAFLS
jgi:4-hydroxy-3-methylbut-2-enyl diphosphate reductase